MHQFRPTSFKKENEITREGLIVATTSTSIRAGPRSCYRFLAEEADQIRNDYIDLMANRMLVLHIDGKIIKHIEEALDRQLQADF